MLYLVGGAARSGKSLLAKRMLHEQGVAYFSTDALLMGFRNGLPGFGVREENTDIANAAILRPLVEAIAENLLVTEQSYLLEGVLLQPATVAQLQRDAGPAVRACFLGYSTIASLEKLTQVKLYKSQPHDWLTKYSDDEIVSLIDRMKTVSLDLKAACATNNLPYFDVSDDFKAALDAAFDYLNSR